MDHFKNRLDCLRSAAEYVDTHSIQCHKCDSFSMVKGPEVYLNCNYCGKKLFIYKVYSSAKVIPVYQHKDRKKKKESNSSIVRISNHCILVDKNDKEEWRFEIKWNDQDNISWEPLQKIQNSDLLNIYIDVNKLSGKIWMILRGYLSTN